MNKKIKQYWRKQLLFTLVTQYCLLKSSSFELTTLIFPLHPWLHHKVTSNNVFPSTQERVFHQTLIIKCLSFPLMELLDCFHLFYYEKKKHPRPSIVKYFSLNFFSSPTFYGNSIQIVWCGTPLPLAPATKAGTTRTTTAQNGGISPPEFL